jgi:DNA-binding NarL/FixJ family response regulator
MPERALTVLIADPNPMTRAGLRAWLGTDATTIEAADLLAALRAVRDPAIAVAVVDARLAGPGTADARQGLRALARRLPVVVMGMAGDPAPYAAAVRAAGGAGYWRKDADPEELVELLGAAAHVVPPELTVPRPPR